MVDLFWTPRALPGLIAWLLSWGAAVAIYRASPRQATNRMLALALFFEGALFGSYNGFRYLLATQPLDVAAIRAVEWAAVVPAALSYVAFLGTVDAPASRPFARASARKLLVAGAGLWILAWPLLSPNLMDPAMVPFEVEGQTLWSLGDQPISDLVNGVYLLALLYGLAVAWSAYRAAHPGSASRSRALAYLRAFGIRDAVAVSAFVFFTTPRLIDWPDWIFEYANLAPPLTGIVFVLLLGYGILKTQLFDIDLKVKWTVEKSTIAATFGIAFVAVSELVEFVLGLEGTAYGLAAAVGVGLVFRRVEAGAEHVADQLMPGVEDTEAYRQQRKREVYRASVEELMADEEITAKERRMLGRLQEELGLEGGEASRIEADVVEAGRGEAA